jgi:ectoine hydroxylase-related dioxygenase (phytanoyl-CoA dioxygenase family)
MAGLTDEQRARFHDDGYLVLPAVFNKREVGQMGGEAARLAQWQVAISLALGVATPRLDVGRRDGRVVLRELRPVNDVSPVFTKYAADDRLVSPLRDLLGGEPVLVEEKLDYRQILPGDPDVAGDEPDEAHRRPTGAVLFRPERRGGEALAAAIAIDETTEENGPVYVAPGSHLAERPSINGGGVPLLAPAGSVFLFHGALAHVTWPSRADGPRRLIVFTYCPDTAEAADRAWALRRAGQAAEDRYEELVYSGVKVPDYRLSGP